MDSNGLAHETHEKHESRVGRFGHEVFSATAAAFCKIWSEFLTAQDADAFPAAASVRR
jgi:hypothetical protein